MTKGLPWLPWSRWIDATGGVKPCEACFFFSSSDRQDRLSDNFFFAFSHCRRSMSLMQLWGRTGWCYFLHQVEVGFIVFKSPGQAIPVQSPCLRIDILMFFKNNLDRNNWCFFCQFRVNFQGCLNSLETLRPCAVCGGPTVLCCSGCEATRSMLNWLLDLKRVYLKNLDIQSLDFSCHRTSSTVRSTASRRQGQSHCFGMGRRRAAEDWARHRLTCNKKSTQAAQQVEHPEIQLEKCLGSKRWGIPRSPNH